MKFANLFAGIPAKLPQEWSERIVQSESATIERIVSEGHCSPDGFWYNQDWDEWVLLVEGAAGLVLEGQPEALTLSPGDHLLIPAHVKHRVAWTARDRRTIWLAVHLKKRTALTSASEPGPA